MISSKFAQTPEPPYYVVIFTAQRSDKDKGYSSMGERMVDLASKQKGFLGIESTEDLEGFEITISYWESEEAIRDWKANFEHQTAQKQGRKLWYEHYEIRDARVERAYSMLTSKL